MTEHWFREKDIIYLSVHIFRNQFWEFTCDYNENTHQHYKNNKKMKYHNHCVVVDLMFPPDGD